MLKVKVMNVGKGTKGHILASCRVQLSSEDEKDVVSILDARVLRNRSGELWVGYPSQSIQGFDGAQRYVPTLEFSRELQRRISDAVLEEYANVSGAAQRLQEFSNAR
jgi:hypothetical protein